MNIGTNHLPIKSQIDPQSVAAAGTASSGWVDAGDAPDYLTTVDLGVLGGGTVTLTFEQANTAGGGAAKALSAWTGGSGAVNSTSFEVQNDAGLLDRNNGFRWFRATLTNVGGTGALLGALIHAVMPRYRS